MRTTADSPAIDRITLRFRDPALERTFLDDNLASRLEAYGEPGRILVSQATAGHLAGRYRLGPEHLVDLKGKGPTPARFPAGSLLSRRDRSGEPES